MTDEHAKGDVSTVEGKVQEGLGRLTGNRQKQVRGTVKQVQGRAQEKLADIQDVIRRPGKVP